ncbi:hypothetical protein O6H91_11G094500 [Diphasiastrum complanatum]|uniref:Uncharacterized protein n=1 Tax=Diphasiastrum complanatum TaxID=34168 RepID=A0ACC2CBW5_DIPCM|nr:hypothetical protein O6H91_Y090500 [Diphasiastrum complanatum]KAJ7539466.1 hypothetical protein O6H91_11G094500 [Diphasiastrum complanatum]
MARKHSPNTSCFRIILLTFFLCGLPCLSRALPATQIASLLRLAKLLENPTALSNWDPQTDFCNLPSSANLNLSCIGQTLVALQIVGNKNTVAVKPNIQTDSTQNNARLSDSFSSDELASALLKFPDLQILSLVSLGIWGAIPGKLDRLPSLKVLNFSSNFFSGNVPQRFSSLNNLQVLVLDNNALSGPFPEWLHALPNLEILQISNNMFSGGLPSNLSLFRNLNSLVVYGNFLTGSLPTSITHLQFVHTLSLSRNKLSGKIPDLSGLMNLQILDLGENEFGPEFPVFGNQLVEVVMKRNKLAGPLPSFLGKLKNIKVLDLSTNALSGSLPENILVLPNLETLNLSNNRLTGNLSFNLALSNSLTQLDISFNFFTGPLPHLLNKSWAGRILNFRKNCFTSRSQQQEPQSYCQSASTSLNSLHKRPNIAILVGIIAGIFALAAVLVILLVILVSSLRRRQQGANHGSSSCADSASLGVPSELLTQARYLSQSIRLGVLGAPLNRVFALHELEEATDNFSEAAYVGDGQLGKVYKGRLENGSAVSVKCIILDVKQDLKQLKSQIEILAKLRHRNLVCIIGHCLERETDEQQYRRLFLVSEFIDNGTLRSHLLKSHQSLNWSRRLATVVGAGRGIQYLHTGVVPGIFNNDVKITSILLDHNFVAKVSDFGLGRLLHDSAKPAVNKMMPRTELDVHHRKMLLDKMDVYNFGLILLELVLGRPPTIEDPMAVTPTIKELDMLLLETVSRSDLVDPAIRTCMRESLCTVIEIAAKCLSDNPAERPSMEDVLWNLQYAAQVQDKVSGDFREEFPTYYLPG